MLITVAINNYNYEKYIVECINSVLKQTYKKIEIIIVDDGSTDNSIEIINKNFSNVKNLKIIQKENNGQLSTFNEVLKVTNGKIVFFLDADDIYKKDYIEKVVKIYKNNKDIDFIFCALEVFDETNNTIDFFKRKEDQNLNIGTSSIASYYNRKWIGQPTSSISMKIEILRKILPVPYEEDWITRADDILVWGASLVGAKKFYLNLDLVKYRVHRSNNFYNKEFSSAYNENRNVNITKFFDYIISKNNININNFPKMIFNEYKNREKLKIGTYSKALFKMNISIFTKFYILILFVSFLLKRNIKSRSML